MSYNPLLLPRLLFFHSYRKVQEGNPDLDMLMDERAYYRPSFGRKGTFSAFKADLVKMMMGQADLFESIEEFGGASLTDLEQLVKTYANAKFGKLRPERGSTLDIRIQSLDPPAAKPSLSTGRAPDKMRSFRLFIW